MTERFDTLIRVHFAILLLNTFFAEAARSSNNTSSCTSHGDCNDCVGILASTNDCIWCSTTNECISKSSADSQCTIDSQKNSCPTPYYTVIFVCVLGVLVCICLVSCFFREWNRGRNVSNLESRQPLLTRTRQEVWESAESEADWMCVICGFDNKTINVHCAMCGTTLNFTQEYITEKVKEKEKRRADRRKKSIKIPDEAQIVDNSGHHAAVLVTTRNSLTNSDGGGRARASTLTSSERQTAFNYRRLNQLSIRQKSARRRRMWQRSIDEKTGQLIWTRTTFDVKKGMPDFNMSASFFSGSGILSPRDSIDARALLDAAASPVPKAAKKDSFDQTLQSTSPGYVSHFSNDGTLYWERVETGGVAKNADNISPHYMGAVSDMTLLEISQ